MHEFYMERGVTMCLGPDRTIRSVPDPDPARAIYKVDGAEVTRDEYILALVEDGLIDAPNQGESVE